MANSERNLVVDGTDEGGCFAGDGQKAPFMVFDVDRQENIAGPFMSREMGEQARIAILAGGEEVLDAEALRRFWDEDSVKSVPGFSTADADRLLGLADQFLEDWEENEGSSDPECHERRIEYDAIRPLFVLAPALLDVLQKQFRNLELLSNGSLRMTATAGDQEEWSGVATLLEGNQWVVENNGSNEWYPVASLSEALDVLSKWQKDPAFIPC